MTDALPSAPPSLLPVSVLTGFLGSGKTTLLSKLVRHPGMARTAVVINEFGDVGLDHLLVAKSSEDTVVMDGGCICCTMRSDLVDTLRELFLKRVRGTVAPFDRVVIETTGLADPAPILHTLMTDPLIAARFRLDGVVTTVDAVNGDHQLDTQGESVKQAAVADRLVLTKTDLATAEAVAALRARLRAINPAAPLFEVVNGAIEPAQLFDAGLYSPATKRADVVRWLRAEAYSSEQCHAGYDHASGTDHDHDDHHGHHHDRRIRSFCLAVEQPLPWEPFVRWMEILTAAHGPNLLRVKGILNVREVSQPVVIHGVQHLFHPPAPLEAWPSDDRRSRIVFITRDLDRATIEATFRASVVEAEQPPA